MAKKKPTREVPTTEFPRGKLLTTKDAAHVLDVIERRVRFLIKGGELKAKWIAGQWFIRQADLLVYYERRKDRARKSLAYYGSGKVSKKALRELHGRERKTVPQHLPNLRQAARILQDED
jgi:hypothetical protein